jgi:hypothetical protein
MLELTCAGKLLVAADLSVKKFRIRALPASVRNRGGVA